MTDLAADDPARLLTLGPLTTTAAHLRRQPYIESIVIMGGAVNGDGNALPTAEANIARDPRAAASVVTTSWPTGSLLVPLETTSNATIDALTADLICAHPQLGDCLGPALRHYRSFSDSTESPCHDLAAAVTAVHPDIATIEQLHLAVDTGQSAAWGTTVVDRRIERRNVVDAAEWQTWSVATEINTTILRRRITDSFTT